MELLYYGFLLVNVKFFFHMTFRFPFKVFPPSGFTSQIFETRLTPTGDTTRIS